MKRVRKRGTGKRAGGYEREKISQPEEFFLLPSLWCFILCRLPVPLRPPPAESSFEVIMGLLANAPPQVPSAPSRSLSPSVATLDERRLESLQGPQIRPAFSCIFFLTCQPHLLNPTLLIAPLPPFTPPHFIHLLPQTEIILKG